MEDEEQILRMKIGHFFAENVELKEKILELMNHFEWLMVTLQLLAPPIEDVKICLINKRQFKNYLLTAFKTISPRISSIQYLMTSSKTKRLFISFPSLNSIKSSTLSESLSTISKFTNCATLLKRFFVHLDFPVSQVRTAHALQELFSDLKGQFAFRRKNPWNAQKLPQQPLCGAPSPRRLYKVQLVTA